MPKVLVIGGESGLAIGFVQTCAYREDIEVAVTSRRPDGSGVHLDLESPDVSLLAAEHFDYAVVFAAVTNMHLCENNKQQAMQINCDAVIGLMSELNVDKWILLSTNAVFDGEKPFAEHQLAVSPYNHYGTTKAKLERISMSLSDQVAVVRLTKVIGNHNGLLSTKLSELRAGKKIEVFHDMAVCPISELAVNQYLLHLIKQFEPGIHHLSGDKDVTWFDVLQYLAEIFKLDTTLVCGVNKPFKSPKYTSLFVDTKEVKRGFVPQSLDEALQVFISHY